jgi:hypothetical protein
MAKLNNGPVQEFVFTDWLKEGAEGMRRNMQVKMENKRERMEERFQKHARIDTSEFRTHMRKAREEQLLAIRSLVDSAIECVQDAEIDRGA